MTKIMCYNCKDIEARPGSVFCSDDCHTEYAENNHIPSPRHNTLSFDEKLANFKTKYNIREKSDDEKMAEVSWQNIERMFERIEGEKRNTGTK